MGPYTFMLTFGLDFASTTKQQLRAREYVDIEARPTTEGTSPSDPLHDLALMSLAKRLSHVVPLRPVPCGRFLHVFHICRVLIWNTRASR